MVKAYYIASPTLRALQKQQIGSSSIAINRPLGLSFAHILPSTRSSPWRQALKCLFVKFPANDKFFNKVFLSFVENGFRPVRRIENASRKWEG